MSRSEVAAAALPLPSLHRTASRRRELQPSSVSLPPFPPLSLCADLRLPWVPSRRYRAPRSRLPRLAAPRCEQPCPPVRIAVLPFSFSPVLPPSSSAGRTPFHRCVPLSRRRPARAAALRRLHLSGRPSLLESRRRRSSLPPVRSLSLSSRPPRAPAPPPLFPPALPSASLCASHTR
ncbi:verprolin-like [Phragmites australis]|uniref:verprolin-like n=1 Tax=Phragmites australis TaxID=29695 RepID=UPI002D7A3477|nr:verprolin-like [Phragmites australis]